MLKRLFSISILIILLSFSGIAYTDDHSQSTSYIILKGHFASAGGNHTSTNYITESVLGTITPVGTSASTNYKLYSGLFTPLFSTYNSIPQITSLTADPSQDFTASSFPYTVTFSATVADIDSSVFDYSWDFGDGNTADQNDIGTTTTITHDFASARESGPYVVTLTVSDGSATSSETVDVYLGPQAPSVEISATPEYGASPLNVSFTGTATDPDGGTITNYEWEFGDGSSNQSGATLTDVTHSYSQTVTAKTVYTATLYVTDNENRTGSAQQEVTLYPAVFFDDFEDGDASDWIPFYDDDWTVVSDDTYMFSSPAGVDSGRHIKAPLPGNTNYQYGTIRVDVKFDSASTTSYKTAMIMWGFVTETEFRYFKIDYDSQEAIFGYRDTIDQNEKLIPASGWSIPLDQKISITVIFRPDGIAKAWIDDTFIGQHDYTISKNGGVGLATRKSMTYFDNFMFAHISDTNSPPEVTVDPDSYVSTIYPSTASWTVTATDPDGDDASLHYYWRFGDGGTSTLKEPSHEYISEGVYAATLDVTDEPEYGGEAETTSKNSYIHIGVDYYDNFNDGDISDWTQLVDSEWSVVDGMLQTGLNNTNNVIFTPYTDSNTLDYGKVCTKLKIVDNPNNLKQNAIIFYAWQSDQDNFYRFVRIDRDDNAVKIMHDDENTTEITDASTGYNVLLEDYMHVCMEVKEEGTGDKVTVYINGSSVLNHSYSTHKTGRWGLRTGRSTSAFDEYVIFDYSTINSTAADIDTDVTEYDFGEVKTSVTGGATYTMTIYNRSPIGQGENLNISSFAIANTEFTVEDPDTGTPITSLGPIAPQSSDDIRIRYEPSGLGADTSSLLITSNDPDETVYSIALSGEGVYSDKPTATVSITPSTQSGPVPLIVTFDATATDPDGDDASITYSWDFGDGTGTSTLEDPTYTYTSVGTYTATLTLTDESGQDNSYEYEIQVEEPFFLDTFNDGDISDWTPSTPQAWVIYDDSGELRLHGFNTSGWDHCIAPSAAEFLDNVTIEFDAYIDSANGGKMLYLIFDYQDQNNMSYIQFKNNKDEWYIIKLVNGVETVLADGAQLLFEDTWIHYKVEITNGVISAWVDNVAMIASYNYGTISNSKNGLGVWRSWVYFDNYKITFNDFSGGNESPTLTIAADPVAGSNPLTVTFTSTADDPDGNNAFLTYEWDFGDSSGTSTAANPTYTYTANGTYTATCTVTDSGIPAMTAIDTIEISVIEGNRVPDLTISANPQQGSSPLDVSFTASATDPDGDGVTYEWDFGDGSSTTATQNPTHQYTADGTYTATCTVTDDGSPNLSTFDTLTINVGDMWSDDFQDADVTDWTFKTQTGWDTVTYDGSIRLRCTKMDANDRWEHALVPTIGQYTDTALIEFDAYVILGDGNKYYYIFDFQDVNNFGAILFDVRGNKWRVYRVVAGNWNEITMGINALIQSDAWMAVSIEFTDGVMDLTLNDVALGTGINYGTFTSAQHGFGTLETKAYFDNIKVTFGAAPPPNQSPTLTIGASPTSGASPLNVTFTSTADDPDGDNASITYAWDFGDSSGTSTEANPTYEYASAGTYTATCVITDSGSPSLTASDTVEITVTAGNEAPVLTISASPTTGDSPLNVTFTASVTDNNPGDNHTYEWNFGDTTTSTTQNPTHQYTADGTYTATCTVTDDGTGNLTDTETVVITVGGPQDFYDDFEDQDASNWTFFDSNFWNTVDSGGSIRLYVSKFDPNDRWDHAIAPDEANFTDTAKIEYDTYIGLADGNRTYYVFDFIDQYNFGAIHFNLRNGKWFVYRVVNDNWNEISQGAHSSIVKGSWMSVVLDFEDGDIDMTINNNSVFTDISYGSFTSNKHGLATLETRAYFDNFRVTFTGNQNPNQPPTVTATADQTTGLIPLTVTFTATGNDPEGTSMTYDWEFGDGNTSTQQNPVHEYTTEGTFTATVTVTDSGVPQLTGTDTIVIDAQVSNHAPTLTVSADPTAGEPSLTVTFTATGDDVDADNLSYSWDFGDTNTSTTQNPVHTYTATGTYTATCTVTDDGSPSMTATDSVVISVTDSYFMDDFNDGTITDWTIQTTGWTTYNAGAGEYYLAGEAGNEMIFAPAQAQYTNERKIEFDFYFRSGQAENKMKARFLFDYVSDDDFGMIYLHGTSSFIELRDTVNAVGTSLYITNYTFNYDTWYHIEITYSGNSLSMSINDSPIFTDINYGTFSSDTIGFVVEKSSIFIDNVIILDP